MVVENDKVSGKICEKFSKIPEVIYISTNTYSLHTASSTSANHDKRV
jgi:hypothetical protein